MQLCHISVEQVSKRNEKNLYLKAKLLLSNK